MDESPILNSPFKAPDRYWRMGDRGELTNTILDGRRPSATYVPVALPSAAAQPELALDDSDREGRAFRQNGLVNRIRGAVDEWRRKDYPHVTHETYRLLEHWSGGRTAPPLFFCQIEAIETMVWLAEAAPQTAAGRAILEELAAFEGAYNPGLARLAAKMATGSGKTTVMALLIAWQAVNAGRKRRRFSDAFLVICPGITIRDRLRVLLPSDPNDYYRSRRLVPEDMLDDIRKARIVIANYHAFKPRETQAIAKFDREVLRGRDAEGPQTLETEEQMVLRVCKGLGGRGGVVVLNDEAHHCYDAKPGKSEEAKADDDAEERARTKEAARLWINGIRAVGRHRGLRAVYDVSATPFFLRGSGYPEGTLFPWVASDFALLDAIESGIVKIPRVPVSDNALPAEMPVWRRLWPQIRDELPKKGAKKAGG